MTICLIGNGYDLHHKLPTNYLDFLHIVQFLIEHKNVVYNNLGEILSADEVFSTNDFIKTVYKQHSDAYNNIKPDVEDFQQIVTMAENNVWFRYLYDAINKSLGWIDFEKEIGKVLDAFEEFFEHEECIHSYGEKCVFDWHTYECDQQTRFIVSRFNFFYHAENESSGFSKGTQVIKTEYIIEDPINSGYIYLDTEKISSDLFESMIALAKIIGLYLKIFVEDLLIYLQENKYSISCASYPKTDFVVNFNYTRTYEAFGNPNANVEHIHGSFDHDIVLGINPNEKDEIYNIDTTFLQFKKYYQRVFYGTDLTYLRKMQDLKASKKYDSGHTLYVIGHSLDETDKDMIVELFDVASKIIVLYHDKKAVARYIRNLVRIYGKDRFDKVRVEKKLTFLKQSELTWNKQPLEYN